MEDLTQTTQLGTGVTGSGPLSVSLVASKVHARVGLSSLFADVQLHMLCHAAERAAPGDGWNHSPDRLQAKARHTSHGQRQHW